MCRLMVANGLISFANGFFFPGFVVRWRAWRAWRAWRVGDSSSWVLALGNCVLRLFPLRTRTHARVLWHRHGDDVSACRQLAMYVAM